MKYRPEFHPTIIHPSSVLLLPAGMWYHFFTHENLHNYVGSPGTRQENNVNMDYQEVGWVVMKWIHLAQDKERWLTFVNKVNNNAVYEIREIYWLFEELLASERAHCLMKFVG
jgi:hypothetical protein